MSVPDVIDVHIHYTRTRAQEKVFAQACTLFGAVALIVLPVALSATLGGLAVGVAEAGFHPNMDLVAPKWERLNPLPKLKQMFMLQE